MGASASKVAEAASASVKAATTAAPVARTTGATAVRATAVPSETALDEIGQTPAKENDSEFEAALNKPPVVNRRQPVVDMETVIQKNNQLLSNLSLLDKTITPSHKQIEQAQEMKLFAKARNQVNTASLTQAQLRQFFISHQRPPNIDQKTAELLLKTWGIYTIFEQNGGRLFGKWSEKPK